jgi:hypothetical protein
MVAHKDTALEGITTGAATFRDVRWWNKGMKE